MNLTENLLPFGWLLASFLGFAPILARAATSAPWRRLKDSTQLNVFLGACVALMVVWSIKAGIRPGLNLHLLGATALTLMFGPALAILGLCLVLLAVTAAGTGAWSAFAANALLMAVLPVLVSHALYRVVDRRLPNHFFVYVFINAFAGGALSMVATGLAATWLLAATHAYTLQYLYAQYLPYYILMAWSEALSTGMIVTLMVVYRPQWVATFDDARYIRNK